MLPHGRENRFAYVSRQPRIQCWPELGTVNGGTAPPLHLILCGIPLARGGEPGLPGAPGFGAVTEQPGTDGIAPA